MPTPSTFIGYLNGATAPGAFERAWTGGEFSEASAPSPPFGHSDVDRLGEAV